MAAADPAGPAQVSQQALYHAVADAGSLRYFGAEIEAGNPSDWPGYDAQLRRARDTTGARHAVTTGLATIGGEPCVMIGFEFGFFGGSIAGARRDGIAHIAVAGDPTTGGVWSSLVASADVLIGVPGARVSFSGSRTRPAGSDPLSPDYFAESKWARGFVDALSSRYRLRTDIAAIVRLLSPRSRGDSPDRVPVPAWPTGADGGGDPGEDAWAVVSRARGPHRARADRWLAGYFDQAFDIHGDRSGGVDAGLRCGFGRHDGTTIAYIAQTGQPTTAAGFRTATRLLALAARLGRGVLTLIDTPGAAAAAADEAAGVGPAIAELLIAIGSSEIPITSVVIGEGVSGGALALASPTDLWMARGGYLAVTVPELAASILKRPADAVPQVAAWLRLTPAELLSRGIIRGIVQPPAVSAG